MSVCVCMCVCVCVSVNLRKQQRQSDSQGLSETFQRCLGRCITSSTHTHKTCHRCSYFGGLLQGGCQRDKETHRSQNRYNQESRLHTGRSWAPALWRGSTRSLPPEYFRGVKKTKSIPHSQEVKRES